MTLTDLSYYVRKYLPLSVIAFLILMIFYFIFKLVFLYFNLSKNQKTNSVKYKIIFSKLEKIKIKDKVEKANFKYVLDNIEGKPVTATLAAEIFLIPPVSTKLSFRNKVYSMAKSLDLDVDLSKKFNYITPTVVEIKNKSRKLDVDVRTFNFSYEFDYKNNPNVFSDSYIPTEVELKNKAIDFLNSLNRYPDALAKGKKKIIYLHIAPKTNEVKVVDRLLDANAAEVDFYRGDINYKVVSPKFFTSQNFVIFAFSVDNLFPIKAQVKFFAKSDEEVGVYPLKTGDEAWKLLTQNKAFIVAAPLDKKKIVIKDMYLAYLDPDIYQKYIQPVYVFLGEDNFVAYIPAVSDDYLSD